MKGFVANSLPILLGILTSLSVLGLVSWTSSTQPVQNNQYRYTHIWYQQKAGKCGVSQLTNKIHKDLILAALYNDIDPWTFKTLATETKMAEHMKNCIMKVVEVKV